MNREIKFRAWDKKENKMIFNPIITDLDNPNNYIGLNDLWKKFYDKKFKLMQFTGLKDKNKKEIYEGDIVAEQATETQTWSNTEFVIKYDKNNAAFALPPNPQRMVVVGNIYENGDLLKN